MDRVIGLLKDWYREPDLVTKGAPNRPVFSKPARKGCYKVVVGPLWTTHYHLIRDGIYNQDSTRTDDVEAVKLALSELVRSSP